MAKRYTASAANAFESTIEQLTATLESFQGQLQSLQAEHEALCVCLDQSGVLPASKLEEELHQRTSGPGGAGNTENEIVAPTGPLSSVPEAAPTYSRPAPVTSASSTIANSQPSSAQIATRQSLLQRMHQQQQQQQLQQLSRPVPSAATGAGSSPIAPSSPTVAPASSTVAVAQSPVSVQSPAPTPQSPASASSRGKTPTRPTTASSPAQIQGSAPRHTLSPRHTLWRGDRSATGSPKPRAVQHGVPMEQRDLHTLMLPLLLGYGSSSEQEEALRVIQKLLKASPDSHSVWAGKDTPIQAAVNADRADLVRVLLRARADPNGADEKGVSMLHLSTYNNNPNVCHTLLMARADVNGCDVHGQTSLFFASTVEVCRLLVLQEADVSILNRLGQSALHMAALGGFSEVYDWLSSRVNKEVFNLEDATGCSASMYAKDAGLLRPDGSPKKVSEVGVARKRPSKLGQKRLSSKIKKFKNTNGGLFEMPPDSVRNETHGRGGRKIIKTQPNGARATSEIEKPLRPHASIPLEPWEHVQASRNDNPDRWRPDQRRAERGYQTSMQNSPAAAWGLSGQPDWQPERSLGQRLQGSPDHRALAAQSSGSRAYPAQLSIPGMETPGRIGDFRVPSPRAKSPRSFNPGLEPMAEERREEDDLREIIGALELLQSEGADFAVVAREYLKKTSEDKDREGKSVVRPEIDALDAAARPFGNLAADALAIGNQKQAQAESSSTPSSGEANRVPATASHALQPLRPSHALQPLRLSSPRQSPQTSPRSVPNPPPANPEPAPPTTMQPEAAKAEVAKKAAAETRETATTGPAAPAPEKGSEALEDVGILEEVDNWSGRLDPVEEADGPKEPLSKKPDGSRGSRRNTPPPTARRASAERQEREAAELKDEGIFLDEEEEEEEYYEEGEEEELEEDPEEEDDDPEGFGDDVW